MNGKRSWTVALLVLLGTAWLAPAQQPNPKPPEPPPGTKAYRDLAYVTDGHERNKLDLYVPEKAEGALPLIVWIHGGGWQGGSKERCPALPLVSKGYAVASINYRLSQHAKFPAQIEDCKAALRWLRANASKYHLDPEHVGVWGASAGGHLVALLGTTAAVKEFDTGGNADQSSKVQCVCDWFGPTDFVALGGKSSGADNALAKLIGGPIPENKDKAAKASPVTYVTKGAAPFLIMQGDMDNLVPARQSELLAEALKKAGVDVTLRILPGAGHGGAAFMNAENKKLIEEFFDKHLKSAQK